MNQRKRKLIRQCSIGLLGLWLLTACASAPIRNPDSGENARMLAVAKQAAQEILALAPEWASQIGASHEIAGADYTARLSDYRAAALTAQVRLNETLRGALGTIDRSRLSTPVAVTYDVIANAYDLAARQNQFAGGMPSVLGVAPPYAIDQLFGPHLEVPRLLIGQHGIASKADVSAFILRLAALDEVLDAVIDKLQADAQQNVIAPTFALAAIANSATEFYAIDASEHPISQALTSKMAQLETMSPAEQRSAAQQVREILTTQTYPAYQRLADAAVALEARSAPGAGIWRLPDAQARYQLALDAYGANGRSAETIHQLGLKDVARLHQSMDAILRSQGYREGSIGKRLRALATEPEFQLPNNDASREQIIDAMNGYIEQVAALAPQWFAQLPDQPVTVQRIPVYEQDAASGAYYLGPSLDGARAGAVMINLKDTADWPTYTLRTLAHHEAIPGHHLQISLKQKVANMPMLRNMMFFSEFGEGWALYAEALAKEMGLYDGDPLGNLGRLRAEVFRAARLVVDTGLHHKRWTRQQAIDWMVAATGEAPAAVAREIERYAVWPGQATSYKLGLMKFQQLRKTASAALGGAFSLPDFHTMLLEEGSMPMPVLEARVRNWITEQQRSITVGHQQIEM